MKKTAFLAVMLVLLLSLSPAVSLAAEPLVHYSGADTMVQPMAAISVSSSLSKYSSSQVQIRIIVNSTTSQKVTITSYLQRKSGSSWVNTGDIYTVTATGTQVVLLKYASPTKGNTYRVKSFITTPTMTNVTFYSNELAW